MKPNLLFKNPKTCDWCSDDIDYKYHGYCIKRECCECIFKGEDIDGWGNCSLPPDSPLNSPKTCQNYMPCVFCNGEGFIDDAFIYALAHFSTKFYKASSKGRLEMLIVVSEVEKFIEKYRAAKAADPDEVI